MHIRVDRAPASPPPISLVTVELTAEEARRLRDDLFTLGVGKGLRPAWALFTELNVALSSK